MSTPAPTSSSVLAGERARRGLGVIRHRAAARTGAAAGAGHPQEPHLARPLSVRACRRTQRRAGAARRAAVAGGGARSPIHAVAGVHALRDTALAHEVVESKTKVGTVIVDCAEARQRRRMNAWQGYECTLRGSRFRCSDHAGQRQRQRARSGDAPRHRGGIAKAEDDARIKAVVITGRGPGVFRRRRHPGIQHSGCCAPSPACGR